MVSQVDTIPKEKNNRIWKTLKKDSKSIYKGTIHSFTQPLHWQKDDFVTAGGIVLGSGILYLSDNEAQKFFSKQDKYIPNSIKEFGFYFGKPQNFFMVSAGVYGFGLITDNEKVRHTGILIFSSAITTGVIQSISKTIAGRARPYAGNHNEFKPFSNDAKYHSFPSGHAILSFSMAHSIAKQIDNKWLKVLIYSVGSIAPISRLWADQHWLSDVGLGIAISIVTVDSIDNFLKGKQHQKKNKDVNQISWKLSAGIGTIGLVGTF